MTDFTFLAADKLVPVFVFVAVLLAVNAFYLWFASHRAYRHKVHQRLSDSMKPNPDEKELSHLRRGRSLSADGHYALPFVPLNRLILQSGVMVGVHGVVFTMAFMFAGAFFVTSIMGADRIGALMAGALMGIGVPVLVLRTLRSRRRQKFEEQLPDAIDILVRGLKAGHAIPVAISAVGRQMSEPLGSEFAITAGELTYGLDLETAMVNLRSRVGQDDLSLIVLAVSVQSKMGGNLAEILTNLAIVIRQRFKLRRKAKALSAEGRFSAIVLSIMPVALFCILWLVAPTYYSQVWDEPYVKLILAGSAVWLMIGNFIMYRMVRFAI